MKKFNKKGLQIRFDLGNKAQEIGLNTACWSHLCKLCKPIAQNLSENEYLKFKWYAGCTVIFWRTNNKIYKEYD